MTKSGNSGNKDVAGIVHRNIRTMLRLRQEGEHSKSAAFRFIASMTKYAGSLGFVYFQAVFLVFWLLVNSIPNLPIRAFDPFPFPFLCLVISAEAIFIAIFILVNQTRMSDLEKKREELDIQISLLTEHEVTKLISIVDRIAKHLLVDGHDTGLGELKKETSPEQVLEVIEKEMDRLDGETKPT
jgi:uncharacterized membrane protein